MPTAIREVELSQPISDLTSLDHYDRCMLVWRWRGVVVGRAFVAVSGGTLSAATVRAQTQSMLTPDAVRVWLEDALGFDERGPRLTRRPTVTVAICTRERPDDLARTLDAVTRLSPAPDDVLVVDNAPVSTRTKDAVARFAGVRYVVEPIAGLDRARNRALGAAGGEVVAFTDDDAVPEREWVGALLENFADPAVLCVTGLTLPLELETPAQELFEEHCSFVRGFTRRVLNGRIDNPLLVSTAGAGANMAVRRSVAAVVGGFDERLDAGTPSRSGGDHEMFTRILKAGFRIVYEPRAVSWHRHRRTIPELLDVVRGYGTGVYAMWTGLLVEQRDLGVLRLAWRWFRYDHLPLFRRPGRLRAGEGRDRLRRAELAGCIAGPAAWLRGRRSLGRA